MEKERFEKRLPVDLTDSELIGLGQELVGHYTALRVIEDEKAEAMAGFKLRRETEEKEMGKLYDALKSGKRDEDVQCEQYLDETTKQVMVKRLDTGKLVSVRPATTKELNNELFESEDELNLLYERNDARLLKWLGEIEGQLDRVYTAAEVGSWSAEEFKAVEGWVELFSYSNSNPDTPVELPAPPDAMTREFDPNSLPAKKAEPAAPSDQETAQEPEPMILNLLVQGKDANIQIDDGVRPTEYATVTFEAGDGDDPAKGIAHFWGGDGNEIAAVSATLLADPAEAEEPDAESTGGDDYRDYVFEVTGESQVPENWTVTVKKSAIPKGVARVTFDVDKSRVIFWAEDETKIKSAAGTVTKQDPV